MGRRPKLSKEVLRNAPPPTPVYTPLPGPSTSQILSNNRKIRAKIPRRLVFLTHGNSLYQKGYVPRPGRTREAVPDIPLDDNPFLSVEGDISGDNQTRHRRKKERQWQRWQCDVIPSSLQAAPFHIP
ncbi:hypothetical protein H0H92_013490 [Tricholoma furcatifolium]|nr:hypothetical protein H0H92_013490 [Tricholoma furcatifolium]